MYENKEEHSLVLSDMNFSIYLIFFVLKRRSNVDHRPKKFISCF